MPDNGRVNNARDWSRRAGRFMERFREVAPLHEVGKTLEELAHVDGSPMQVKEPLGKDRHGNHAANQDGPHEQAALLDVVDHRILS
jgi:hypothetical protein